MRQLARVLSSSLMFFAAVSASADRADANAIIGYDKIIDVGQRSNATYTPTPAIDDKGNVTDFAPATVGDYTSGTVFNSDSGHQGEAISQFLHRAGSDENLLTPALQNPGAYDIQALNASGHIVGSSYGSDAHAFYYAPETGQLLRLKSLPGATERPVVFAINGQDQFVGEQDSKAIFYASPLAEPIELSKLLTTSSGWRFIQATGINDRGEIVGYGVSPASKASDFKLESSPVPEPTALSALIIAGAALAARSLARQLKIPGQGLGSVI